MSQRLWLPLDVRQNAFYAVIYQLFPFGRRYLMRLSLISTTHPLAPTMGAEPR